MHPRNSSSLVTQAAFEPNSANNIKQENQQGFKPINNITGDDKKVFELMNHTVNKDLFTMLNEWLLIEFSNYQQDSKHQKDRLHARLNRLESDNFRRYKDSLAGDEEGLLRLFIKLKDSEVSSDQISERATAE
jgi:hypothetical protein